MHFGSITKYKIFFCKGTLPLATPATGKPLDPNERLTQMSYVHFYFSYMYVAFGFDFCHFPTNL